MADPVKAVYELTVTENGVRRKSVDLESFGKNEITFGRNAANDIVLETNMASRFHGRIVRTGNGWSIEDSMSTNGIYFAGRKITKELISGVKIFSIMSPETGTPAVELYFSVSTPKAEPVSAPSRDSQRPADEDFGEKTMKFGAGPASAQLLTIYEGESEPVTVHLDNAGKAGVIAFGRSDDNNIILRSSLASRHHGRFVRTGSGWKIEDLGSTNGLFHNGVRIENRFVGDGDIIRIDSKEDAKANGILFVFSAAESGDSWQKVDIDGKHEITIGREKSNTICIPHISVSRRHASIFREGGGYVIQDLESVNGVFLNGTRVAGKAALSDRDVISITNTKIIFTGAALFYCHRRNGITVDVAGATVIRGKAPKQNITCNSASLTVRPGELVAIVGGSGAGKSTLLNCMSGYLQPARGSIHINGEDLYSQFDSLKSLIGYIPQSDIVYGNLSLHDMLMYTAKLRLPADVSDKDREEIIDRVIATVDLPDHKNKLIKTFSGGQKKRASIAVELLSDPNLLYLDEPASGLDPATERSLMESLRAMSRGGKTIVLVTHSTLQLHLCDKIAFMGKGGNLCFYGTLDEALAFFGVNDVVDIYALITDDAPKWRKKYDESAPKVVPSPGSAAAQNSARKPEGKNQLPVLCARSLKLIFNDKIKLLLIIAVSPLLAALMAIVLNRDEVFVYREQTSYTLFALACCAIFVGLLNAIQEICGEREILKREYMAGLSLGSYIGSKTVVMGLICAFQALLMTLTYGLVGKFPVESFCGIPYLEFYLTTFLTMLSSTALGLFVSALVSSTDKALIIAPILLMPQILFAGMFFELTGVLKAISYIITCHWSLSSFGASAGLNNIESKIGADLQSQAQSVFGSNTHVEIANTKPMFDQTMGNVFGSMLAMLVLSVAFIVLARIAIRRIGDNRSK